MDQRTLFAWRYRNTTQQYRYTLKGNGGENTARAPHRATLEASARRAANRKLLTDVARELTEEEQRQAAIAAAERKAEAAEALKILTDAATERAGEQLMPVGSPASPAAAFGPMSSTERPPTLLSRPHGGMNRKSGRRRPTASRYRSTTPSPTGPASAAFYLRNPKSARLRPYKARIGLRWAEKY